MQQVNKKQAIRAAIAFAVLGIFFLMGLGQNIGRMTILCKNPVTVQAVVVDNEQRSNTKGSAARGDLYVYDVFVSYEVQGQKCERIKLIDDLPRNNPATVGAQVEITVDGENPEKILVNPGFTTYLFASLSFFCIVFAAVILAGVKKNRS